jgi:hypothetical protein
MQTGMWFLRILLVVSLTCLLMHAQGSSTNSPQLVSIVERMQDAQSSSRPAIPYQLIREYSLFGEKNPNPSSEVWAEIDYLPPNRRSFIIQKRVGSGRGEDVVRRILQRESQMATASRSESAVDNNNYSFEYLGVATFEGSPCYLLGLNPKRKDVQLVRGKAWVDQDSFRIRHMEGEMAKSPSWLLKKISLKIDFADFGGAWLQNRMQAVAEVRVLGNQTLKSEIIDARVGNLTTQKTAPALYDRSKSSRVPAN